MRSFWRVLIEGWGGRLIMGVGVGGIKRGITCLACNPVGRGLVFLSEGD